MVFKEFGHDRAGTLLLLHGGGLSWWNYRAVAELLASDHRVILPVLDGHAGSDRPFTSIEDNAEEIIAFIQERLGGSVPLMGGLSLGGQVLLEMLSRRPGLCRCALVESASVIPSPLTAALVGPSVSLSYPLVKNRGFPKLQFASLRMPPDLFEDYYRDTCRISRGDMAALLRSSAAYGLKDSLPGCGAALHVFTGARETSVIRRSGELLSKRVPGAAWMELPGLYHGEFSLSHPRDYAETLRKLLSNISQRS